LRTRVEGRGSRGGFSLAELMVVAAIIGLTTYAVALSFDALVPRERLNTAIRNLTAILREARSDAISRNLPHMVEYDIARRRYRILYPFSVDIGVFREGVDAEDRRLASNWELLPDGVDFHQLWVAGEVYDGDQPYRILFDARGSATEHIVVLSQPRYEAFHTVEILALSGHFRMHDGIWVRDPVDEQDFR
jgi:prepilin-type N-terminal cleavage/methylation domain-containing protein